MMANSARDPYWHAAVRREVMDHPVAQDAIEDKCSTCHMPMARYGAAQQGAQGKVFENIYRPDSSASAWAADGVSCTVCHQIVDSNFGEPASFTGGFQIDITQRPEERMIYGPHSIDGGRQRLMQSAGRFSPQESSHLQESELCATCHTLYTHALNSAGEEIAELAEQVPYLEWLHSDYRTTQSCQACHMPELSEEVAISSVLGQPRPNFSQHVFRGGNAFMLGILNKHRGELGVEALPQELDASIRRTQEYLGSQTATVSISNTIRTDSRLRFEIQVRSLAGHKLPTAYPSRRVWLHVTVRDERGEMLFESGAIREDGSIVGNDNDADGSLFEPHYDLIERPDQVQIYEPILADSSGEVTTGLLSGVRYVKDNRIPPRGFDKQTADSDIGVFGGALTDETFVGGGDRVTYEIAAPPSGRIEVEVELLYQSIGYRWARNLAGYRSTETDRFVRFYEGSSHEAPARLAAASATADR
jgi:hypothetical protein